MNRVTVIFLTTIFLNLLSCSNSDDSNPVNNPGDGMEQELGFVTEVNVTRTSSVTGETVSTSSYDELGRVIERLNDNGTKMEFSWIDNLLTSLRFIDSSGGLVYKLTYGYDTLGKITYYMSDFSSETLSDTELFITYSSSQVNCSKVTSVNGQTIALDIVMSLNSDGFVSEVVYDDGLAYQYNYLNNDLDTIKVITDIGDVSSPESLIEYSYSNVTNTLRNHFVEMDPLIRRNNSIVIARGLGALNTNITSYPLLSSNLLETVSTSEINFFTVGTTGDLSYVFNNDGSLDEYVIENITGNDPFSSETISIKYEYEY